MEQSPLFCLLLTLTVGGLFVESLGTTEHVVGDSLGWVIPPNSTFYEEWANSKTFVIGDKLVFSYRSGMHNVVEVPKEDYEKCSQDKAIDTQFLGPTVVDLNTTGTRYYYCGIGTHCSNGQKLTVEVSDGKGRTKSTSTMIAAPVAPENKPNDSACCVGRLGVMIIGSFLVAAFLALV